LRGVRQPGFRAGPPRYRQGWLTALLLCLFLGGLGVWVLIDLILIITGGFTDKQGQPLAR